MIKIRNVVISEHKITKSPVGDISVVTLVRTDTTLDHSGSGTKRERDKAGAVRMLFGRFLFSNGLASLVIKSVSAAFFCALCLRVLPAHFACARCLNVFVCFLLLNVFLCGVFFPNVFLVVFLVLEWFDIFRYQICACRAFFLRTLLAHFACALCLRTLPAHCACALCLRTLPAHFACSLCLRTLPAHFAWMFL